MGLVRRRTFAEAAFDGIGGSDPFALGKRFVLPAGKQFVEVVAQATDGFWVIILPPVGEPPGGGAGLRHGLGIHDRVEIGLDRRLIGDPHLSRTLRILCAQQRCTGTPG
jgi:hypothetical protein